MGGKSGQELKSRNPEMATTVQAPLPKGSCSNLNEKCPPELVPR